MKTHDKAFYEQVRYLLRAYRSGHIKTIPDLKKFIDMTYGDYLEFHPNELPEKVDGSEQDGSGPSVPVEEEGGREQ